MSAGTEPAPLPDDRAPLPHDLVSRAVRLAESKDRSMLGIAGPPGSGKSAVASELCERLGRARTALVPMDGFHLANQELARLGRADRKGAPDTFDVSGYVALLARLGRRRPGEVVYAPSFDRQLETAIAGSIRVEPATALVVTEGNYLLLDEGDWRQVRPLLDEVWYLDVAVDVRRRRLIERHAAHGRSAAEAERWADGNDARNGLLVDPTRVAADVVVGWNAATGWTVQAARSGRNASA